MLVWHFVAIVFDEGDIVTFDNPYVLLIERERQHRFSPDERDAEVLSLDVLRG